MKSRIAGRIAVSAVAVLALAGLFLGAWVLRLQLTGNIHVVDRGVLYRSAQLDGDDLAEVLSRYRIKAVINLRGRNPGNAWYEEELRVTAKANARHFDVGIGATSEPEPAVTAKLLHLLRTAPRPILIHCYSGADRSGLAAALYEYFVNGEPAEVASKQLSFWYGHFPWLGSRTVAMDNAFQRLSGE